MALKFVLVEIVLVETVLVGDPLYLKTQNAIVSSVMADRINRRRKKAS